MILSPSPRSGISKQRWRQAPPIVHYIPEWISAEREAELIGAVLGAPKPKWEQLAGRRLQNWGGIVGKKGSLIKDTIPPVGPFAICQSPSTD